MCMKVFFGVLAAQQRSRFGESALRRLAKMRAHSFFGGINAHESWWLA